MNNAKKLLTLVLTVAMIFSTCALFSITASAAKKTDIVREDLVIWYDASNNSNGLQDHEATVWKDLSGNGNHMTVKLDEKNYWTDNAFHVENNPTYFPDAAPQVANGEQYTIEMVLGEVNFTATNWITLMCSDNDEFSLFVRVPNGDDTDNNLEYKYNDQNQDRPKMDDGAALLNNSTMAITFDLTDPAAGICTIYVNGVALTSGVPTVTNIADTLCTEFYTKVAIGISTAVDNIKDLARAYKEAQIALDVGKVFENEKSVVSYENLGIGRLIYQLPTTLCEMFLQEVFKKGSLESLDRETLMTIQCFFENNLNVSETSRKLFVHRNTLVYRLEKIRKLTGLDLREFEHAITFKVALMVKKYLSSKPGKF